MKKVTVFVGSPRRRHTHEAVGEFLENLHASGGVESEIVRLTDYELGTCRGCQSCFAKGEEICPLKDDRDVLLAKIMNSDGVVFASPNYSFQVSAVMKIFLDRLGFLFHRPRYHGRTFTSIVVEGVYGGTKIVDYLDFVGAGLGFDVVRGVCCNTREPMTEQQKQKCSAALAALGRRFHAQLWKSQEKTPTLRELMVFRMSRTLIRQQLDESSIDWRFYAERGWLESDYFYPTRLGPLKKTAGRVFDLTFTTAYRPRP